MTVINNCAFIFFLCFWKQTENKFPMFVFFFFLFQRILECQLDFLFFCNFEKWSKTTNKKKLMDQIFQQLSTESFPLILASSKFSFWYKFLFPRFFFIFLKMILFSLFLFLLFVWDICINNIYILQNYIFLSMNVSI